MSRQDHLYVNLPRSLVEVVDTCVTNIISNGAQVYKNKKDFIIKAVVQQIENEKSINRSLARKIDAKEQTEIIKKEFKNLKHDKVILQQQTRGGNRSKNV